MNPFSVDIARSLPGPEWLRARRVEAAERWSSASLPTADEEIWRYSRIGSLDLSRYQAASADAVTVPEAELARLRTLQPSALVVLIDGKVAACECSEAAAGLGVSVSPAGDGDGERIGSVMTEATDVFADLNIALCPAPIVVDVPRGVVVPGPVVVVNVLTTDGIATFPRLVVRAGDNSEVTVLDQHTSAPVTGFTAPVVELEAAPSARLRYLSLNQLGDKVWHIGSQVARGERDSSLLLSTVALGGDYARTRIDAHAVGQGSHTDQIAVYFGDGTQMHDFRTYQDHAAPKSTSNLLFKGAVQDTSRSVYTGLIRVRGEARGTRAFQANRNLKLSDGAWADSVPNLDIETNDVQCSHASAVGPIDPDQRFYLESRGVPSAIAERLIVLGFFDEVLTRLPVPAVLEPLRRAVEAKLDRRAS